MHQALQQARARIEELESKLAKSKAEFADVQAQLEETIKLCELQQADLERFKKAYESTRPNHPERVAREQLQLAFERVVEKLAVEDPANDSQQSEPADEQPAEPTRSGDKRKRRHRHGRRNLDLSNLEVKEVILTPDEVLADPEAWTLIDEDVSQKVAWRAGSYIRIRLVRRKYVAKGIQADDGVGEEPSFARISIAPLPDSIWPGFMADPSAISQVIVSKYDDLLPLNRQQSISARQGFMVPKSTQCSWLGAALPYCEPVVEAMFAESKRTAYCIATDATGARVRPVTKGDPCDNWHVFVFIADRNHIVFRYAAEHSGATITEMLDGYRGYVLADASSIYDVLYREHEMTEVGCWYHARRGFYRAIESEPGPALEVLSLISKLFEADRACRKLQLDVEAFTRERAARAGPIIGMLDKWVELHRDSPEPRGRLKAAIGYYENQRDALHRFLGDGRLRLDNCPSEQQLRKLVLGQHNWTYFANETGLRWYTVYRSLIASCGFYQLNCQLYLEQLLRLAPHWPKTRIIELSPKYWAHTVAQLDSRWRAILTRPWESTPSMGEPGAAASNAA